MRTSSGLQIDYYWRDYTGYIPGDAIEGGRDINQRTTYIGQILCSQFSEKFKWVSTDAKNLHVNMIGKHLVVGGVDYNRSSTNLGRILHKGEVIVAKVCGSEVGNAKLYYWDGNSEKTANSYEVLTYE